MRDDKHYRYNMLAMLVKAQEVVWLTFPLFPIML